MSRHSKWSKIKHQKGAADVKRSALFTRLSKNITLAVREGGSGDPKMNFKLRLAIDQAKAVNLPKDTVDRAIQKGIGAGEEGQIERVQYEGFLPGGAAIIIESLTDNRNRTSGVVKNLLGKHGGNMGLPNSVAWMFLRKGVVRISNYKNSVKNFDEFQLKMIDFGADDIQPEEEDLVIYTAPENLEKLREGLEKEQITPEEIEIEFVAKEKISVTDLAQKEKIENLLNELDENEDVDNYYTNLE
ncbi:YebC/PmpR family DNA-binding transcriptional regulator [Candidatus Falkowbacteria bacterium]|nr:YebC/PmpR family DNA-binding transcriptional regulator [Candidatus Falkowbacteria bacterium]